MVLIDYFIKDWKEGETSQKLFMIAGAICLLITLVGIFLPILPQVPSAIAAALLFAKGSPRIHHWIRENKYMGQPVKDWEDHRVIRPKLKLFSFLGLVFVGIVAHYNILFSWAILTDVVLAACLIFVLTTKSKPQGPILT